MKRKLLIIFLSIVTMVCLAIGISACSNNSGISASDNSSTSSVSSSESLDTAGSSGETLHTHNLQAVEAVAATCTKNGTIAYWYCTQCGEWFSDAEATTTISYSDAIIKSTGHTESEWIITYEATCTETGSMHKICTVCGEELENEEISMVAHSYGSDGICTICHTALTYSEGLEYTLNDNGTSYSVSGIGTCSDSVLVIPSTYNSRSVTTIANNAFYQNTDISIVNLPNSITSIGKYAFSCCTSLTSINIPDNVTIIDEGAFSLCSSLESVIIPDSVTTIDSSAFSDCYSLLWVTLGDGISSISSHTFYNCQSLTSITIPDNVTAIYNSAFKDCYSLTNINIPYSVMSIGDSLSGEILAGCTSLKSITVDDNNAYYKSVDGNLYSKDGTELIQYAAGKTDSSFEIPDGVTTIGEYAFYRCRSLENITIPDSVTSIGGYAFG